ncbi:enoyl-CoA hydratase-related protein, partial [Parasphingorhabdus sp.]
IVSNMDMRFGVRDRTRINQMEIPLGILPGGTGTQNLPRIVGRARAMEIILSGEDIDAETAERWGYLNRIYDADEIDDKVAALATKIASYPIEAVRLGKQSVDNASGAPEAGLLDEAWHFQKLIRTDAARENMQKFLEIGGQTRTGELQVDKLAASLNGLGLKDREV